MALCLSDRELEALRGLPLEIVAFYVMAIRPRMDFASGLVGVVTRISWQALTEDTYIEPRPGIKGGSAHRESVRRWAAALERAGLLSIRTSGKQLILKCLLARTDQHVRKKADINPTDHADTPQHAARPETARDSANGRAQADRPDMAKADIHPVSDKQRTNTPPTPHAKHITEAAAGLVFPSLPEIQKRALAKSMQGIDAETAQAVLDELAAALANRERPLNMPMRFAMSMIRQARAGEFIPDRGVQWAEARQRRAAHEAERQRREQEEREQAGRRTTPAAARQSLGEFLKGRRAGNAGGNPAS